MGCGASSKKTAEDKGTAETKKEEAGVKKEETVVKEAAKEEAKKEEEDSGGFIAAITEGALDVVGAVATVGGATLSMVGNGMATGILTVADCATLGMVDSIGDARDECYEDMKDGRDDVAAGFKCHSSSDYYRGEASCSKSNWMAKIPDTTNVTSMFIPGTHDTLADNGGDLAECQGWSVKQQLESGLRVLDLRFKHDGDKMCAYHGIINLHKDDISEIKVIEEFLEKNPTEALFARIKKEGQCGDHACDYHDQMMKDISKPHLWNLRATGAFGQLSGFRGKITLLAFGSPIKLFKQDFDLQDEYDTGDEDKKFKFIMDHAAKSRPATTLQISFCSAVGKDGWTCFKAPGALAYNINKMVFDAKDKLTPGLYLFDFPGNKLIEAIVDLNAPLIPK